MNRRILVNLVSFTLLAVLLTAWAATNYVTFGLTEPPSYEVEFTFSSSPGLRPGFDVAYLGVPIGTITDVQLQDQDVRVLADVRDEFEVTADVLASIRRRSAVGEPFIDLQPKPEADLAGGPSLRDDPTIPVEDTSLPLSYEEVFGTVSELLAAIPTDAVATITHELAVGLEGREDDLTLAVRNFESVATTLGARAELFDQLTVESAALADFIAGESNQIAGLTSDLELLASSLRASRDDLTTLLDTTPDTLDAIAAMLDGSRASGDCLLDAAEAVVAALDTTQNSTALRSALGRKDELIALLDDVTHERPGGLYLRVDAFPGDPDDDLRTGTRAQPPTAPGLLGCGDRSFPDEPVAGPASATAGEAPPLQRPVFDDDVDDGGTGDGDGGVVADDGRDTTGRFFEARDVSPLVLLLPLALAGLVGWSPWRRRG